MENAPTPTNDNKPEVTETTNADAQVAPVFDFTDHQDGQKTFAETGEQIDAHNNATKTLDFSDANIASGNPIQRDLTPDEINEKAKNDQNAELLTTSKGKFSSYIVNKLFHRG